MEKENEKSERTFEEKLLSGMLLVIFAALIVIITRGFVSYLEAEAFFDPILKDVYGLSFIETTAIAVAFKMIFAKSN